VDPGPVPTEWQEVAGEARRITGPKVEADQVVREALAAYDRGRRSIVPGAATRWLMRATKAPRSVQLRVVESLFRPRD
jgi:short-subunit dehydrogenase